MWCGADTASFSRADTSSYTSTDYWVDSAAYTSSDRSANISAHITSNKSSSHTRNGVLFRRIIRMPHSR